MRKTDAIRSVTIQSYRDNGGVTDDPWLHTDHRPWPMPERRWTMAQRWHDLLFAHWPVRPEKMRALPDSGSGLTGRWRLGFSG